MTNPQKSFWKDRPRWAKWALIFESNSRLWTVTKARPKVIPNGWRLYRRTAAKRKASKKIKAWCCVHIFNGHMNASAHENRYDADLSRRRNILFGYHCGPIVAIAVPAPMAGRGVGKK